MKNKLFALIVVMLITTMLLGACAQPDVEETPVEAPPTEIVVPQEPETEVEEAEVIEEPPAVEAEVDDDEDARMEALIREKIQDCHMYEFILRQTKTAEEWDVTITRMIGKGAQINDEEKEMIIDWLVARND